jgi:uncharacterized protein DUF1059
MTKVLKCGDVVPGCNFEMRGNSEDEILKKADEHAKTARPRKPARRQPTKAALSFCGAALAGRPFYFDGILLQRERRMT